METVGHLSYNTAPAYIVFTAYFKQHSRPSPPDLAVFTIGNEPTERKATYKLVRRNRISRTLSALTGLYV